MRRRFGRLHGCNGAYAPIMTNPEGCVTENPCVPADKLSPVPGLRRLEGMQRLATFALGLFAGALAGAVPCLAQEPAAARAPAGNIVSVTGKVRPRPEGTVNPNLVSGEVEVLAQSIEVLNPSLTPPFMMDYEQLSENVRLEYRFLDLRRAQMQKNLRLRYKVAMAARRRPIVAAVRTTRSRTSATVVGLTSGTTRSSSVAAAMAARLPATTAACSMGPLGRVSRATAMRGGVAGGAPPAPGTYTVG